jgi:hypothetical protein
MEDSLAREEQVNTSMSAPASAGVSALDDAILAPAIQALIARCIDGKEPYGRDLKINEVQKFNSNHVQAVLLRVAGFRPREIAEMVGLGMQQVYLLMTHPYTKKIIKALVPEQTTRVINIRTRMEEQAAELMDHAFGLAMASQELKDVKDVTFGFLDRAGYGAVQKTANVSLSSKDLASEHTMSRVADALGESNLVDTVVMPNWTSPRPPEEGSRDPLPSSEPELVDDNSRSA